MKTTAAHLLRRIARKCIKWSNKLDHVPMTLIRSHDLSGLEYLAPGAADAARLAESLANRSVQHAGQIAGMAVPGLMETLETSWQSRITAGLADARPALPNQGTPIRRSRITRLMDWLERTDWGYGLGLLAMTAAAVIALFGSPWWWISIPLVAVAFALCWWFG